MKHYLYEPRMQYAGAWIVYCISWIITLNIFSFACGVDNDFFYVCKCMSMQMQMPIRFDILTILENRFQYSHLRLGEI